jgi:hypothetical protein
VKISEFPWAVDSAHNVQTNRRLTRPIAITVP